MQHPSHYSHGGIHNDEFEHDINNRVTQADYQHLEDLDNNRYDRQNFSREQYKRKFSHMNAPPTAPGGRSNDYPNFFNNHGGLGDEIRAGFPEAS